MINRKRGTAAAIYGGLFLLMLLCNIMTPYAADDFRYLYSFYDGERLESLYDVFMSMRVHRYHMNGRLVVHTLVELFTMVPAWVFDVVNALMYTLQIALVYELSRSREERSNSHLVMLICGAWIFCPAFGQVNLWQDGSCNYLWSCVFAFVYLKPMWEDWLRGETLKTTLHKGIYLVFAFVMGACSENVSSAAIFMAMLLLLLMAVADKRKPRPIWCGGLVMAVIGYLSIYTAPAQLREKGAEMKLSVLLQNFGDAAVRYWHLLGFLLILFVILLAANWLLGTSRRRVLLSLVFLAGSLAANFIMMFAQYYTDRSAVGAYAYLLAANGILLYPLMQKIPKKLLVICLCLVLLATSGPLYTGVKDIAVTYRQMQSNEAYILQCKEAGVMDVKLPLVVPGTKYCQLQGLTYLDTETTDIGPNKYMALWYGVDSILGVRNPE